MWKIALKAFNTLYIKCLYGSALSEDAYKALSKRVVFVQVWNLSAPLRRFAKRIFYSCEFALLMVPKSRITAEGANLIAKNLGRFSMKFKHFNILTIINFVSTSYATLFVTFLILLQPHMYFHLAVFFLPQTDKPMSAQNLIRNKAVASICVTILTRLKMTICRPIYLV